MQNIRHKAPRLFLDDEFSAAEVVITEREAHYLGNVLRLSHGDEIVVFNGRGQERLAAIKSLARNRSVLTILAPVPPLAEPELELLLIQALIKTDAMDSVVQKAAELGVSSLFAVKTDFSVIKLNEERTEKRIAHWQKIARSACEQSGRHRPPEISVYTSLEACLMTLEDHYLRIAFHPGAQTRLRSLKPETAAVCLLIGPEGGFSNTDLTRIDAAAFTRIGLGPRVLRADTAATAVCSAVQLLWGDAE